jgi:hypothetical protein
MFLLHVLLAIALTLGAEFTVIALVELRVFGVLVIIVTFALFLGRQAQFVVFATLLRTLEGPRMGFFVFGKVTFSGEDLVA